MSLSSLFNRPVLIYDNKCTSCIKFARLATKLSRGWIRTIGHYDSDEILDIRNMIFPVNYDPTKMFWLVNKKGIYGGRKALIPLIKEIIISIFTESKINDDNFKLICDSINNQNCSRTINTINRVFNLFKIGERFHFKDYM